MQKIKLNELITTLKTKHKFNNLLTNEDPKKLLKDPWSSNFELIKFDEDPVFCQKIADLLNEGEKQPRIVAIMRSVDDPTKLVDAFHSIHIDSRKSDKTLFVLSGNGEYPVFSQTELNDFNFIEKIELYFRELLGYSFQKIKLYKLQEFFTHSLSQRLKGKVYKSKISMNIPGTKIKFNNMLPHHSHPRPTKYSLLLQVVYS